MKALILNSGTGRRMGVLTAEQPKCMTEIAVGETILSRQLKQLAEAGVSQIVMTTGPFDGILVRYCESLGLPVEIRFVKNPRFQETNYIYSVYCSREYLRDGDLILLHGDMVFENSVLDDLLSSDTSVMAVSSTVPLPEKDFKAVMRNGRIEAVGVDFFNEARAAYPLYKLRKEDWALWLDRIVSYCESGEAAKVRCYAENALNEITGRCALYPLDVRGRLCGEIDNPEDLAAVSRKLAEVERRTAYISFSTDILHSGHIALIKKAARLGRVIAGVMTDEAVASFKRYPLVPYSERKAMFENLSRVWKVVAQNALSYRENLETLRPDYVVHGDDWISGFQRPVRDEVTEILASYGGKLVEFPYARDEKYSELEARSRSELAMPDVRRGRLRRELALKGLLTALEAHDGLTGLVVENTAVYQKGAARQFDAVWISSLCDSTAKGKPDMELVDMSSRFRTVEDILEVTTKPVIFDGDTGGRTEHFVYTVRSLERLGVSMMIIEDKTGLKKNSLFGVEANQTQESVEHFCRKIAAGKRAQKTRDFMICARIESLILERGLEDALQRAFAFTQAGADAVMIHSRREDPAEIFAFLARFREKDAATPLVLAPTSFHSVREEEWKRRGANVVIYANHLMRAAVPAIQKAARTILECRRAEECDRDLMPFQEIIRLIPPQES